MAAQAVVHHREQTVGIRWEVHSHHRGFFIHNVVDKTWVLVGKPVVILTPHMGGQQIIQRGYRAPPGNLRGYFEPLGVLVEHRINNMDKGFVAIK